MFVLWKTTFVCSAAAAASSASLGLEEGEQYQKVLCGGKLMSMQGYEKKACVAGTTSNVELLMLWLRRKIVIIDAVLRDDGQTAMLWKLLRSTIVLLTMGFNGFGKLQP